MLNLNDCYLQPKSKLDIVVKNGNVIGFTLKNDESKKIIYLNDSFLCLEELPQEENNLSGVEFIGVTYLPFASAFVFCKVIVNIVLGQCYVTKTCDSYNEKHFDFNKFIEPKRVGPYTYIINENCVFPDGSELSNISLFNVRTGHVCSVGKEIKQVFDNSSLMILNIRLVPMENDIHRLEIVFGDRKTFRVWDTIYMGLKVNNTKHFGLNYQVCNNFYSQNYKDDGYYLESKLAPGEFFSKVSFLIKLSNNEFIKDLESKVNNYYSRHKKRILI